MMSRDSVERVNRISAINGEMLVKRAPATRTGKITALTRGTTMRLVQSPAMGISPDICIRIGQVAMVAAVENPRKVSAARRQRDLRDSTFMPTRSGGKSEGGRHFIKRQMPAVAAMLN